MPPTVPIKVREISSALWALEDWVRSLREVLSYLPESTTVQVPKELVSLDPTGGGGIILIRGCPPPCPEEEEDGKGNDKKDKKDKKAKQVKKIK